MLREHEEVHHLLEYFASNPYTAFFFREKNFYNFQRVTRSLWFASPFTRQRNARVCSIEKKIINKTKNTLVLNAIQEVCEKKSTKYWGNTQNRRHLSVSGIPMPRSLSIAAARKCIFGCNKRRGRHSSAPLSTLHAEKLHIVRADVSHRSFAGP